MKWYEWLLVLSFIFFSCIVSFYFSFKKIKEETSKANYVYVVDLPKLIDNQFSPEEVKKVYEGKITPEEFLKEKNKYLNKIKKILDRLDRPVFIKQAVVGGKTIDITEQVEKALSK